MNMKRKYRFTLKEDRQARAIAKSLSRQKKYKKTSKRKLLSIGYAIVVKNKERS